MDDAAFSSELEIEFPDITNPVSLQRAIVHTMVSIVGRDPEYAESRDWYIAVVYFLRGILGQHMARTRRRAHASNAKRVYYLSVEYLPGRMLPKVLTDFGILDVMQDALQALGIPLDKLVALEADTALGNGGLGRLAACLLDSLASHGYPGFGYGIRYEFGMFRQSIENGQQVEHPENWLRFGDPWQIMQSSINYVINFNGRLQKAPGGEQVQWTDTDQVSAVAFDLPITGYRSDAVLYLRLWAARASRDFDLRYFNEGNYIEAVRDKTMSETLSKVLYPNDATTMGQELRLKQEYFFVSASIQDILRRHLKSNPNLDNLAERVAIQMNDTHPSLAVPELMRLLVDVHHYTWDRAWDMIGKVFGYTNHTLLPEALETWPIAMFERLLPRHLDIIYRINYEHLGRVHDVFPGEMDKLSQLSLVNDADRRIRMAHMAVTASHRVNGVSELQTNLLKDTIFPAFTKLFPDKFIPITNGITPRQWLVMANPALARLITAHIGDAWPKHLDQLERLAPLADDPAFRQAFAVIKQDNKHRLARLIKDRTGVEVDPASLFDIQVKRIHEYKRQLLNLLNVIARYRRIKAGLVPLVPRTVMIGGKAAPGYDMAKRIIHLIGDVANVINTDPEVRDLLRLVFIPDYKVSSAQIIIPGADLAQHISTAGTEASGTSNMKFALNGALTLGTLDGANIEIRNAVGEDNMFVFGLQTREIAELRVRGYNPWKYYESNPELHACLDMIGSGAFSPDDPGRHAPVRDSLLGGGDNYMLLADFQSYLDAQARIDVAFSDSDSWNRRCVWTVAHMGRFSSDRTIHEYADKVWGIKPLS
jgi:starch phosphorylase